MSNNNSNHQTNNDQQSPEVDLEAFRQDWLREVQSKKVPVQSQTPLSRENTSIKELKKDDIDSSDTEHPSIEPTIKRKHLSSEERRRLGLEIYKEAILDEKKGKLGEALSKYRRAFKLDPDVDISYRTYFRQTSNVGDEKVLDSPFGGAEEEFEFVKHIDLSRDYVPELDQPANESSYKPVSINWAKLDPMRETLNELLVGEKRSFEEMPLEESFETKLNLSEGNFRRIAFKPADETKPCHISRLSDDLLLKILQILASKDLQGVGHFASSCIKGLFLSRDNTLWKTYGETFYNPETSLYRDFKDEHPSVSLKSYIASNYGSQWRFFLIDYPRVRFDGIYISTCCYLRQGMTENTFHQPIHLITYYRYLRFYPDGTCQKLLTVLEPSQVVHRVFPGSSHFKETLAGEYKLTKHHNVDITVSGDNRPGVEFHISLDLKSTSRGRHNKLSWVDYNSLSTGDTTHYSLKQFKPFYFSKVKSYPFNCPGLFSL